MIEVYLNLFCCNFGKFSRIKYHVEVALIRIYFVSIEKTIFINFHLYFIYFFNLEEFSTYLKTFFKPLFIQDLGVTFAYGSTYLHQTVTESVFNQYTHFDILTCQKWLQNMECPLILLRFLGILIHFWIPFMSLSLLLYLRQTFTDCVSNKYTNTYMSTYQMWLQVIECFLILLRFFVDSARNIDEYSCQKCCIFTT